MTPKQKKLVQTTWKQVAPIADTAASMFYERLFEIDPSLRALFHRSDPAAQRRKLMQALDTVVHELDDLEKIVPLAAALGRRHAGYGVTDTHFATVGAALLWTLEEGLGAAWTPVTAEAWRAAYGLLSGVMRDAAKAVGPAGVRPATA